MVHGWLVWRRNRAAPHRTTPHRTSLARMVMLPMLCVCVTRRPVSPYVLVYRACIMCLSSVVVVAAAAAAVVVVVVVVVIIVVIIVCCCCGSCSPDPAHKEKIIIYIYIPQRRAIPTIDI